MEEWEQRVLAEPGAEQRVQGLEEEMRKRGLRNKEDYWALNALDWDEQERRK